MGPAGAMLAGICLVSARSRGKMTAGAFCDVSRRVARSHGNRHISVRDGQIHDAGSWLYAWLTAARTEVVYVGGTGLPPVVRASLHLYHDDTSVARIAHRYPQATTEPVEVLAFRLPDDVDRHEAKAEIIRQLHALGTLSTDYVGDRPDRGKASEQVQKRVAEVVRQLVPATTCGGR